MIALRGNVPLGWNIEGRGVLVENLLGDEHNVIIKNRKARAVKIYALS